MRFEPGSSWRPTAVHMTPATAVLVPLWGVAMVTAVSTTSSPPSSWTYHRSRMPPKLWPMTCTRGASEMVRISSMRSASWSQSSAMSLRRGL